MSDAGRNNTSLLKQAGIKVMHGIDATKLHKVFSKQIFDTVIFQFPHSGSREPIRGLNPNYVLIRDFMISARHVLKNNGTILITTVDNDFYNNMFRFEDLSKQLNMLENTRYVFDPKDYPEYEHTMTHQDESGIDNYNKFVTWEFRI